MKLKSFEQVKNKALYIHIPFCLSICTYCDFSKLYYKKEWVQKYLQALKQEMLQNMVQETIDTIYIGGGTPSSLDEEDLETLLKMIKPYAKNVLEYSIELNPETMNINKLKLLKKYGVTRLSIGVQTFNEKILKKINRQHSNQQVFDLINQARLLGFEDISIDLMYNLPNQTIQDIQNDLKLVKELNLKHISYYSLILEEHTILYNQDYTSMSDEEEYACNCLIINELEKMGLKRYEISNFAYKGYESLHNLVYWHHYDYYGFGLGAHGFINHKRYYNTRKLTDYFNGIFKIYEEELTLTDLMFETIMLGLRLTQGINIKQFDLEYQVNLLKIYDNPIQKYINQKMLMIENGYLKATPLGLDFLNDILVDIMSNDN
ncbi:MAG: radical SAM family heme chaperone HemW [Erysipelotrichaceae bacterium]|nr:radical SAM family heme chaperone HemW [Erysipelotrichaceae bacterium]